MSHEMYKWGARKMKYVSSVKDVDYFNDNHNLQRVEGSQ